MDKWQSQQLHCEWSYANLRFHQLSQALHSAVNSGLPIPLIGKPVNDVGRLTHEQVPDLRPSHVQTTAQW